MNVKFADKVFRAIFIFVFIAGTIGTPTASAAAQPIDGDDDESKQRRPTTAHGMLSGSLELAGSLGGWINEVAIKDNLAFIGEGLRMLILDVSNPSQPTVIGQTLPLPDIITGIEVMGNYLYASNRFGGFRIFDISLPSNPVQIGYLAYPGFQLNTLDVDGTRAYLAAGCHGGLRVVDIADPFHPTDLGAYMAGDCTDDVVVENNYAYVAGQSGGLYILDVTDPTNITTLSILSPILATYRLELLHAGENTYLYISEGLYLKVVNVTDPANPVVEYQSEMNVDVIALYGNYAYVGGGYETTILDISQPETPTIVGIYGHGARSIAATPSTIYLAGSPGDMHIVDSSDPVNLSFVSSFGRLRYTFDVLPVGDTAYLPDGNILTIADPTNPEIIGTYTPGGYPEAALHGTYLYVIAGEPGEISIFDVSDAAHPVLLNTFAASSYIYNIAIAGDLLLRFDDTDTTLRVFDLIDPAYPTEVGALPLNGAGVTEIVTYNSLAFLSTTNGLVTVDLSNPAQPQIISTYETATTFLDVSINYPYTYLIDGSGNLSVVDVTNPASISLVGALGGFADLRELSVSGSFVFLIDGPSGVHAIDVSDPQAPARITSTSISYDLLSIAAVNEWIYLTSYSDGLLVLKLQALNHFPAAEAGGPYTAFTGEPISLDASASSDPEGEALTYEWDLDNNGEYNDAAGMTVTTVFNEVGELTIGLRVTDTFGLTATDTASVTVSAAPIGGPGHPIRIVFLPAGDPQVMETRGAILLNALNQTTGLSFTPIFPNTVADVVREICASPEDTLGFIPSVGYVLGNDLCGATVSLRSIRSGWGNYWAEVLVRRDSGIDSLDDLNGLRWAFPDDLSASGYEAPMVMWNGAGISPGTQVETGNHPTTIKALYNGVVDVATTFFSPPIKPEGEPAWQVGDAPDIPDELVDSCAVSGDGTMLQCSGWQVMDARASVRNEAPDVIQQIRILAISGPIPNDGVVFSASFPTELRASIENAFTGLVNTEVWSESLGALYGWQGLMPAADADYSFVREMVAVNGLTVDNWGGTTPPPSAPYFGIWPVENRLEGAGWLPNSPVHITVDDPSTGPGVDYSATTDSYDGGSLYFYGDWAGFTFMPGFVITLNDDVHGEKELTIPALVFPEANPETDTIIGTAVPDAVVDVWGCGYDRCATRHVTADGDGLWTANFAVPGYEDDEQDTMDLRPGSSGDAKVIDGDGDFVQIHWYVPNPSMGIWPEQNELQSWGWPPNASIALTVDDPSTGPGADFSTTLSTDRWGNLAHGFYGEIDLKPGFLVRLDGGGSLIREHTIADLAVTGAAPEVDTLSGTADPGAVATIYSYNGGTRHEVADENGNWTANFGQPGDEEDEQDTFDLQPGGSGYAVQREEDGDYTQINWQIPNPSFGIWLADNALYGWGWRFSSPVLITVDDPATGPGADFSTTVTSDGSGSISYSFGTEIDLHSGLIVTIDGGAGLIREQIIPKLDVTDADPQTEMVYGVTDPNSIVTVWACGVNGCGTRHETADGNGDWTVNFASPGAEPDEQDIVDLQAGSFNEARQTDEDGDFTTLRWGVTDRVFNIVLPDDYLYASGWMPDTPVEIMVDDPATGPSPDFSTTLVVDWWGHFNFPLNIDLQPGFVVSLSDGTRSRELVISGITAQANAVTDTVSGSASAGTRVGVYACSADGAANCSYRYETADSSGNWTANFAVPGDEFTEQNVIDIGAGAIGFANEYDTDGDYTQIYWRAANPVIAIYPIDRQVFGWDWTPQATVQVSSGVCSCSTTSDAAGNFYVRFGDECHLQAGDMVTTTDGINTRTYMIANLVVTNVDPVADTVSGTAYPGSMIRVEICEQGGCFNRHMATPPDGKWVANFAVPGDEPDELNTFDLKPGHSGQTVLHELDGNATSVAWRIPRPIIWGVTAANNWINGNDFLTHANVQISIDDPSTPQTPDHTTTFTTDGNGNFSFQAQFDITVGAVVSVTDGSTTKQVTVSNFRVNSIDWVNDTMSGMGTPNASGAIWLPNGWESFVIDPTGQWQVELAGKTDITPQAQGFAIEFDGDGDGTQWNWQVPMLHVNAEGDAHEQISGFGWPAGNTVTLSVDDPSTPQPVDYTASAVVGNNDPNQTEARFSLNYFDLQAGYVVTMTDGVMTKTHTILPLSITDANVDTDVISGTAAPGSEVRMQLWCWNCPSRTVTADSSGNWVADFSVPGPLDGETIQDIWPGLRVGALQYDDDNDATRFDLDVLLPFIQAVPDDDRVIFEDWELGETVTLEIENPITPESPDYTTTAIITGPDWDPSRSWFELELRGEYDLKTGDIVTSTNGILIKQVTVTNLALVNIDLDTDVITGTAEPGSTIDVHTWDPGAHRRVVADESGQWLADFSMPGGHGWDDELSDIIPGASGMISQGEEDLDQTVNYWQVPNPFIIVQPEEDVVSAFDWPLGTLLQIEIDDSETPQAPDYNGSLLVIGTENFENSLHLSGIFDVQPDHIVTVSGGNITRQHVVTHLAVTNVDVDTDTVSGTGTPGAEIHVGTVCDNTGCASRNINVDDNGNWIADFSVPVTGHGDAGIVFDLRPGSGSGAYEFDEDEDATSVGWEVPNPGFEVVLGSNNVNGWDWPMGSTLTVIVDDPSTTLNPDYQGSAVVGPASWDLNKPFFEMVTTGYELKPGDHATVTDGVITKTTTIAEITVNFDVTANTISGTTTPDVEVHVISDDGPERFAYADSSGNWSVDFSAEQDGNPVLDLVYGSAGVVAAIDEDGDRTYRGWDIPFPQCQPGDTVSGAVFEHGGVTPVPFADIQIEDYSTGEILFVTAAGSDGSFACFLPDGDYRVRAWMGDYSYTQEYYNEAADVNATMLHVTNGVQFTNINFTITPVPAIEHFTFNLENPLLQDLAVRQAIALGTDRERILTEAFLPSGIYGMVSNSIVVPEHWASAPASELDLYPFDPVEARAILETAGWIDRDSDGFRENTEGVELSFVFKTGPALYRQASAEIFRQNMEDIGIRIAIEFGRVDEIVSSRDFDIAEFAWVGCTDNEPCLSEYVSSSPYNHAHYTNPAYDAAIANARIATGEAAKLPYLIEAQSILMHDLPILPLFTRYDVNTVTTTEGADITVTPASYLTVHFGEVTQAGVTTVIPTSIAPVALPPNFQLLGQIYDIGTSAQFTTAQVCFTYDDSTLTPAQEETIRLFHLEGDAWVDVTDTGYANTTNNVVCGTVSSFSPFAILYSLNQPPQAELGPDLVTDEGTLLTLDASNSSDPETGPLTYEWDLDNDGQYDDAVGVTTFITFPDNGEFVVRVQVTDDGGLTDTDLVNITVNNVAPSVTYLSAPLTPLRLGTAVQTSAMFEDPGTADTFTATWTWEDGSTSTGDISDHFVSGSHIYAATGVYTVHLTVADDDGGSTSATYQYVVIYDPTGGFVTGGGWFIDPATGSKAHYGFNPKYHGDSAVPKGETEFRLGDLRFKSTSHEWLVISGTKAQFHGTGTINGVAGYEFLVTVIDSSPDRVRIRIWESATGEVIYDNQPGAPDTADPTIPTGGGSIVIHQ